MPYYQTAVINSAVSIIFQYIQFAKGTKLHLQFMAGHNSVDVLGKAVFIKSDGDGLLVGMQSASCKVDFALQLLG